MNGKPTQEELEELFKDLSKEEVERLKKVKPSV